MELILILMFTDVDLILGGQKRIVCDIDKFSISRYDVYFIVSSEEILCL
jgi:hypothetical protein